MLVTGVILIAASPPYLHQPWLHAKLLLVAILIALDLVVYSRAKALQAGQIELRRGQCLALHGVIALILVGILVLVLVRPFY
jgi:uncharacterized membrane protein